MPDLLYSSTFAFVSSVLLLYACQLEIWLSSKILCAMTLRRLYWSTRLRGLLLIHETWPWSLTVLCMVFGFFLPSNIESFLKARMRSCMLSETFINTQTWSKFRNLSWWSDWVNVKSGGRGVCWRNNMDCLKLSLICWMDLINLWIDTFYLFNWY